MAQLLTQKRNVQTKEIILKIISDWDSYLHSIWLEKIASSPGFYDDARESNMSGLCKCGCTRAFTLEVRKKKK